MHEALTETRFLQDLWTDETAAPLSDRPLDLLQYRSNLLGADLRITNFGGGNTSSKCDLPDPLTGAPARVMAVKGSGGDLRSIRASGFALLYLDKLEALIHRYRGEAHEDEMVACYPLCAFGDNPRRRLDRHAAARVSAVRSRRSSASGLGDRAGRQRERRHEARRVQRGLRPAPGVAAMAATRLRAGADVAACG